MEDVLGIEHLSIYDAHQRPMTDVRSPAAAMVLRRHPVAPWPKTELPMPRDEAAEHAARLLSYARDAPYWANATTGYDWSQEDRIDTVEFNRILWRGLFGDDKAYPIERSGQDLRRR
jgi:hypothetical protein